LVARRTCDFIAALASSVVESTAMVLPLSSPRSAAIFKTKANTAQNTSSGSRLRVLVMLE